MIPLLLPITELSLSHEDWQTLEQVISELSQTIPISCVIGYGSLFNGTAQPHSDVDLLILSKSQIHEKHLIQRHRTFEVVHIGIRRFMAMLEKGHVCYVPAMLEAKVLYDAPNLTPRMSDIAQARYQAGPSATQDSMFLPRLRSRISTLYSDMQDSLDNTATFQLLHIQLISAFYTYLCTVNNAWGKGEKHMFAHIELLSESAHKRIINSLSVSREHDKHQQISALLEEHNVLITNEVIRYA